MGRRRTNVVFTTVAIAAVLLSAAVLFGYLATAPSASTLRLGFFPNLTHVQALYGIATHAFQDALQRGLGDEFAIQAMAFNAGPTAIQALLSNQVDLVFVGPSPTLSGLAIAGPNVLRVIAGAASGGAFFVVQPYLNFTRDEDFGGKKFATPQARNTQDIALKYYLFERNHTTLADGGDVDVINAPYPDILSLFQRKQIDGAWVPEPWATRLVRETNGTVLVDERDLWPNRQFVTTHLVTTKRYLELHQDILRTFLAEYVNVTLRLQKANASDLGIVNDAIYNLTEWSNDMISAAAFTNLNVTYDPIATSLATYLNWAKKLGFIDAETSLGPLYDLNLLNQILDGMGLPRVSGL